MSPFRFLLLFVALAASTACVTTRSPDCGMYDFDCDELAGVPAQVNAGSRVAAAPATADRAVTSGQAPAADRAAIERRLRAIEAEQAELRRLLEGRPAP